MCLLMHTHIQLPQNEPFIKETCSFLERSHFLTYLLEWESVQLDIKKIKLFRYFELVSSVASAPGQIQSYWLWLPNSSEITQRLMLPGALTWCGELFPAVMKPTAPINQSARLHLSVWVWIWWSLCVFEPWFNPFALLCEKEKGKS